MANLPPLPPGYRLAGPEASAPPHDPNLFKPLLDLGATPTNGFRTQGDVQRLRREGYTPAEDGEHNRGNAVDFTPGKSGLSLSQLQSRANAIASRYGGRAAIHNGTHVHVDVPGWGMAPGTPGTPNSGLPPLPPGFTLQQRGSLQQSPPVKKPRQALTSSTALTPSGLTLTGKLHDGDTFGLSNGRNGRLFGADAFELGQQGRLSNGSLVPLGTQARNFMAPRVGGLSFIPTGSQSYGRPVGSIGTPENDPAQALLRNGLGMAAPQYLKGSPQFAPYMEAERLARLNRLGGFQTNAETPEQFRHHDGPWQGATPGTYGPNGTVLFKDEPTPFLGLRDDIESGLLKLWADPNTSADDVLNYAKANGFQMPEGEVRKRKALIAEGKAQAGGAEYLKPPAPLIDPGDGKTGAFLRGLGDPLNMIDELGGVADTVGIPSPGAGGPRETIFNSDRRFGDILWNNIDQNRSILGHDDQEHPYARMGGQLASGLAIPAFGVEGVAAKATEQALARGASEFAANIAARKAVAQRLAAIGGSEGGAMGFGGAEGNPIERLPSAAVGAASGAVVAPLLGEVANAATPLVRRGLSRLRGKSQGMFAPSAPKDEKFVGVMADDVERIYPDAVSVGPDGLKRVDLNKLPPGLLDQIQRTAESQGAKPFGKSAAMSAEDAQLVSDPIRQRDYLNLGDVPPPPPGYTMADAPFGVTRPMGERLSAEEMAKLAEGVDPRSVLPRPSNIVESLSEAEKANPSRFVELQAPNETDALPKLPVGTGNGTLFAKPRVRRDIYDITKMLRKWGGVQDQGGELSHLGITNAPRDNIPFGRNEQFLGKLISDKGMTLDEAGEKLWEAGYFNERPTVADVIDALHQEHLGNSIYHPEDLAAVDEFHRLQDQRHTIEQAQHEGSPLVDERGESINLDDLVANTPPADAYEERPRLVGKVGNINLARLERPQDVAQLIKQVSSLVGGFSAAARGKITHEETAALAHELGLKPEQLLRRQQGQALNAEQLYASRALVQRSRETVGRLAKKAVGGSDEDLRAFRAAWLRHVALEEQVSGATAEAARALSQQRMIAKGAVANADAVRAYLKASGGRETVEDAARAIVDLMEDPAKANHFMREAVKPRWRDKFNELWINSLLSGPTTHAVNMVGNALTTALSFPETAMAAAIGKVTRSEDRAYFGEVGARAAGLADSAVASLRAARKAFATGEASDEVTKVENAHHQAIGGRTGSIIRLPTRALTAEDEFWSGILRGAELHQLAYRKALQEAGGSSNPLMISKAVKARYKALLQAPTDEMLKAAEDSARYYTFRNPLGPTGRAVQNLSNNWIGGKLVIPFVRTPINILKFAGERSVLGLAMPEVRAALRSGGRARDEALAKITLGSGLSTAAVVGAMSGRISGGGPTDPRERAALLQSGWQPYSVRIGNKWVSYSRFDPVSTLFGVAADFAEAGKWATKKEADAIALNLAVSIAKNVTNKTWLSGLSDAFDVLSDPERYGKRYFQRLAGSAAVPSILNQAAQATDPYMRDARSIMDGIKARIPVLSESVPARLNVWGEPIERGDAVGFDFVSPFYTTKATNDPVKLEVARLRVPLSMPQRNITVHGQKIDLTPEQFAEYARLAGKPAKAWLDGYIRTPEWRAMSDEDRRSEVVDAFKDFRSAARDELLKQHPELGAAPPSAPPGYSTNRGANVAPALPPPPPGFTLVQQHRSAHP